MPEQSTEEWGGGEEFYGEGNGAEPGETVMVESLFKVWHGFGNLFSSIVLKYAIFEFCNVLQHFCRQIY